MWRENVYKVVLFGHRDFCGHRVFEERITPLLKDIIINEDCVEIYIGRNGEFDVYAASVVKRIQRTVASSSAELICVLPYPEKDMVYYEKYYDSVMIPECVEAAHPKGAITRRNRWMVEQADLFVCYVERKSGGAYKALEYARRLHKQILNLAENK